VVLRSRVMPDLVAMGRGEGESHWLNGGAPGCSRDRRSPLAAKPSTAGRGRYSPSRWPESDLAGSVRAHLAGVLFDDPVVRVLLCGVLDLGIDVPSFDDEPIGR
jgi:hypothetical protein